MPKPSAKSAITVLQPGEEILEVLAPDFLEAVDLRLENSSTLGSAHTVRAYRGDIQRFNDWRQGRLVTKSLVEEYLKSLGDSLNNDGQPRSPAYINRSLAALRAYARSVIDLLHDDEELNRLLPKTVKDEAVIRYERILLAKKPRGSRAEGSEAGRYIPRDEIATLLDTCLRSHTKAGVRDAAMIALAWSIGPRVHEIAKLRMADVRRVTGKEPVYEIRIIGKGNKERPITPVIRGGTARYLQDWLDIRGGAAGALFCAINKGDNLVQIGKNMIPDALRQTLEKRGIEAGLDALSWHDFRRTFISDIIAAKGLVVAQKAVGHSSSSTTAKYDRLWKKQVEEAITHREFGYDFDVRQYQLVYRK